MKDINLELFKRYKPENKISIVEGLAEKELLGIKESTIIRIIKETGEFEYKSKRDKHLRIKMERRKGNDWNSTFSGILYHKGVLYADLYLQYENTDASISEEWSKFLRPGTYKGQYLGSDMRGNPRTYYFDYFESDKAECLRSLLLEYIHRKYSK